MKRESLRAISSGDGGSGRHVGCLSIDSNNLESCRDAREWIQLCFLFGFCFRNTVIQHVLRGTLHAIVVGLEGMLDVLQ